MTATGNRLLETVAKLEAQLSNISVVLTSLNEVINGTQKSGGLKERMAIVEEDVKRNKASFDKIDENIKSLRNEMLIEVGKISTAVNNSKPKGINWNAVMQAVVTAIAVGVTGIAFWQFVVWLAAHSPVK
jgi:predicted RNase H-like nuclease